MPTTLSEALAHEDNRDQAASVHFVKEAARSRGVCISGMGPTHFAPRSAGERFAAASRALEAAQRNAATPGARYMACVVAAQQIAARVANEELHRACEVARACASRGIEGELDHAANCLSVIDGLGGDVRTAQVALAELTDTAKMAAE